MSSVGTSSTVGGPGLGALFPPADEPTSPRQRRPRRPDRRHRCPGPWPVEAAAAPGWEGPFATCRGWPAVLAGGSPNSAGCPPSLPDGRSEGLRRDPPFQQRAGPHDAPAPALMCALPNDALWLAAGQQPTAGSLGPRDPIGRPPPPAAARNQRQPLQFRAALPLHSYQFPPASSTQVSRILGLQRR